MNTPISQTGIVRNDTPDAKARKRRFVIEPEQATQLTELEELKLEVDSLRTENFKLKSRIRHDAENRVLLEAQSRRVLTQLGDALIVLSGAVLVCMRNACINEMRFQRRTESLVRMYKKALCALDIRCPICMTPDGCNNRTEFMEMLRLNCDSTGEQRAHWMCTECYAKLAPKMHGTVCYRECPQCRGEIKGTTAVHQDLSPLVVFGLDDILEFGSDIHDLFEQAQTFVPHGRDPLRNCIVAISYMYTAIKNTVIAEVPHMNTVELMRAATDAQNSIFVSLWNDRPLHMNCNEHDREMWEMIFNGRSSTARRSPLEGIFGETAALCREVLVSNF